MLNKELVFYNRLKVEFEGWAAEHGDDPDLVCALSIAPELFKLICELSWHQDVPYFHKAGLTAAIVYFISPLDLFPEGMDGHRGYVDDVVLAAHVVHSIRDDVPPELLRTATKETDQLIVVLAEILRSADHLLGAVRWKKLKQIVSK